MVLIFPWKAIIEKYIFICEGHLSHSFFWGGCRFFWDAMCDGQCLFLNARNGTNSIRPLKNRLFPRTQMTLVLLEKGLVLEGWPSKIEVIWALGSFRRYIFQSHWFSKGYSWVFSGEYPDGDFPRVAKKKSWDFPMNSSNRWTEGSDGFWAERNLQPLIEGAC